MLKQKQAFESVKPSSHSKNLGTSLVGSFIKSKLYFLILLTMTTGGVVIGNIMVPKQIHPAQAQTKGLITKLVQNLEPFSIYSDDVLQFVCRGGATYGRVADHIVHLDRWNGSEWVNIRNSTVPYGGRGESLSLSSGYYRYRLESESAGNRTGRFNVY